MRTIFKIFTVFFFLLILIRGNPIFAQKSDTDTFNIEKVNPEKQKQFYDSLKYKASRRKLTRMIYDFLISPPRPYVDKKALAINYYSQLKGKIISEINIKPLDVFGPTFEDTTRKASNT